MLWILKPTLAAATLDSFGAMTDAEGWGDGVYFFPPGQKTGIVVIHQLPETPDTLWLRILGKHKGLRSKTLDSTVNCRLYNSKTNNTILKENKYELSECFESSFGWCCSNSNCS